MGNTIDKGGLMDPLSSLGGLLIPYVISLLKNGKIKSKWRRNSSLFPQEVR
jgi:hypothetical protein